MPPDAEDVKAAAGLAKDVYDALFGGKPEEKPPAPAAKPPAPAPKPAAKPPAKAPAKPPAKKPAAKKPAAKKKPPAKGPESHFEKDSPTLATFMVEVDSVEIGRFTEISGLQVDIDVFEYEEGGEHGFVHKLPGRMKWPNLVLKRGVTNDDNLLRWLQNANGDGFVKRNGKTLRTSAAITLVGANGTRLRSWVVDDALPVRWTGPNFASSATSELPEEELEIAHHGFRSKKP